MTTNQLVKFVRERYNCSVMEALRKINIIWPYGGYENASVEEIKERFYAVEHFYRPKGKF